MLCTSEQASKDAAEWVIRTRVSGSYAKTRVYQGDPQRVQAWLSSSSRASVKGSVARLRGKITADLQNCRSSSSY